MIAVECPNCDNLVKLTPMNREENALPEPGDIMLCGACNKFGIFEITVRLATEEEAQEFRNDTDFRPLQSGLN